MLDKIFDINSYNLIEDNDNYYFFRALNNGDLEDYQNKIITDSNNKIIKIRTDLERYRETPKYTKDTNLSIEELIDHIKPNHRYDTNCISLSTNANVAALYGREYYKDKYVIIKINKKEINKEVIDAGLYLLKKIKKLLENYKIKEIKKNNYIDKDAIYFNILNNKQIEEKNSIINKINSIDSNLIKDIPNNILIETINNAFLSLEFIHYKSITKDKIIEIDPTIIDAFSIIQQLPINKERKELIGALLNRLTINKENILLENNINIDNKLYYLAKSKLRVLYSIDLLNEITNNKYKDYLSQHKNKLYGPEPNIFSKENTYKYKANDYVYLNINEKNIPILDNINELNKKELESIIKKTRN